MIVAFRKHTLLPLDDCFYALQATLPHLTAFLAAYNFAKRLKTLKGFTPYEYICKM